MMDNLVELEEQLVDGHLAELAIEALADDRDDLLHDDTLAHLATCERCMASVAHARAAHDALGLALRVEIPDGVLDALVENALASAVIAPAVRTSPRSLALGAGFGVLIAGTLGALSLDGLPSIGGLEVIAHRILSIVATLDRFVDQVVPGGSGTLALGLALVLLSVVAPLRALLAVPSSSLAMRVSALLLLSFGSLAFGAPARALDFEGTWPAEEKITVVAEDVPASVALERAAQSAGLGFVGVLSVNPTTRIRVSDASLRDVVVAVLGRDAPFVVERTPTLLIVREAAAPAAAPSPAPSVVPAPVIAPGVRPQTPNVSPPMTWDEDGDRVSFGGDVVVRAGETVKTVMTLGGDATIEGEVLRDVVTMGGDVRLHRNAIVHGEIFTLGGEVHDERIQTSRMSAREREALEADDAAGEWLSEAFESGASHALIFLLGLLFLGLAPARLDVITRTLTTRPGRAAAVGMLATFASLVLAVILVITIIGIPAALLLALAVPLAMYGGVVAVALVLGRILPIRALEGSPVRALAAGVLALFVISLVPGIGALVGLVIACIGLGAVVLTRAGTVPKQEDTLV